MDDIDRPFEQIHWVEQHGNVRIVFDDTRSPGEREPVTIRILLNPKDEMKPGPPSPLVHVIHKNELAQSAQETDLDDYGRDDPMTFGEGVTVLIALGVLIYLIYALLWPERF